MIAFWILLIHSVFRFALAAPVAVGEILEVGPNAVDVPRGIIAWEKRMDIDSDNRWSTNEAHRKDDNPGSDSDSDGAPGDGTPGDGTPGDGVPGDGAPGDDTPAQGGPNEEDMATSEMTWDSEQMESGARGPDPAFIYDLYTEESDNGDSGYDSNFDTESGIHNGGYDGDSDSDATQNSQGSVENTSLGPESEHPATPEHMSDFGMLLKGELRFRPRNSVDTKAYVSDSSLPPQSTQVTNILTLSSMVRARATSVSSVTGGGASVRDLPVYRQNRKKWILDRLD
jgi:hypothetical protein